MPLASRPLNPFAFALAVAIVAGATVIAVLIWTRRYHGYDTHPVWWPYSERQFQAFMRALPSTCIAGWAAIGMIAGFTLRPAAFGAGLPPLVSASLVVFVLAALLALATATVGKPGFLIPPHLRS